jgi:hypothetical protein
LSENTIRPTGVGKKNWLFIGGASAGDRIAIHTITESYLRPELHARPPHRDISAL